MAEVGQAQNLSQTDPALYMQYDVPTMRCSVIIYQSFCHSVIFIILLSPPATIVYLAAV